MQRNVSKGAPDWVRTVAVWSVRRAPRGAPGALRRPAHPAVAGQPAGRGVPRAVLPGRARTEPTGLVLDLDPPEGAGFERRRPRRRGWSAQALEDAGLAGAVKTSGSKGVHVVVPVRGLGPEDVAAATRALAARAERLDPELATTAYIREDRHGRVFLDSTRVGPATIVAAYSPRIRPGLPVSAPVAWDALADVRPGDVTVRTAAELLGDADPWAAAAARAAGAARRPGRRGAHHPGRPGRGDARGQAPRAGPARGGGPGRPGGPGARPAGSRRRPACPDVGHRSPGSCAAAPPARNRCARPSARTRCSRAR